MSTVEDRPRISKGLAGVVVDTTATSKVTPEATTIASQRFS